MLAKFKTRVSPGWPAKSETGRGYLHLVDSLFTCAFTCAFTYLCFYLDPLLTPGHQISPSRFDSAPTDETRTWILCLDVDDSFLQIFLQFVFCKYVSAVIIQHLKKLQI